MPGADGGPGHGGAGQSSPLGTGEGGGDGESREGVEGYEGREGGSAGRLADGEENLSGLGPAAEADDLSDDVELLAVAVSR